MQFRRIGTSGLVASVIGLGTNNLGLKLNMAESREVVHAALDAGVTLFDTSDSYGLSEERLGILLDGRRDDVILATKFGSDVSRHGLSNGEDWGSRASRRYLIRAVEASLRRLRTEWIDLYQLHFFDPLTPLEETLSALDDLVRSGKVRYIGCSNVMGWQLANADWVARTLGLERFVSAQNEYSWLNRGIEHDLVPALRHFGVGLLPYYPLASGLLTGKYRRDEPPPTGSRIEAWGKESLLTGAAFDTITRLEEFAAGRGISLLDIAVGGLVAQPFVSSVIAGATSRDQVLRNVAAASWEPTQAELFTIRNLTGPAD